MKGIEQKRFKQFTEELKKYEWIDIDTITMLIRRYTQGNMRKRFFNEKAREHYYSYWIKLLEWTLLIPITGKFGVWKVINCDGYRPF